MFPLALFALCASAGIVPRMYSFPFELEPAKGTGVDAWDAQGHGSCTRHHLVTIGGDRLSWAELLSWESTDGTWAIRMESGCTVV